jgi:large subunit ribosomal protein L21
MYVVFATGGKQYRAATGEVLKIEKIDAEKGATIELDQVLMVGEGADVTVGTPYVDGGKVTATVLEHGRGDKIKIVKFRRRKHSRTQMGHRQYFTKIEITDVATSGKKAAAKPKVAGKPAVIKPTDEKPAPKKVEAVQDAPKFLDAPEGNADDLKKISGVGPVLEKKLNALGIYHFSQIEAFTTEEIQQIDGALNFKGRIDRDNWLEQAAGFVAEAKSEDEE